jgi:hypothetical protein
VLFPGVIGFAKALTWRDQTAGNTRTIRPALLITQKSLFWMHRLSRSRPLLPCRATILHEALRWCCPIMHAGNIELAVKQPTWFRVPDDAKKNRQSIPLPGVCVDPARFRQHPKHTGVPGPNVRPPPCSGCRSRRKLPNGARGWRESPPCIGLAVPRLLRLPNSLRGDLFDPWVTFLNTAALYFSGPPI